MENNQENLNTNSSRRLPIKEFRDGGLKVVVWENNGKERKVLSFNISKSYQDLEGTWKQTQSLNNRDLLPLAELAKQAYHYSRHEWISKLLENKQA